MQPTLCPHCGLVLESRQVTCPFCGTVVLSQRSRRLFVLAVAAMFILLVALVVAQLFVIHHSSRPPGAETGAQTAR